MAVGSRSSELVFTEALSASSSIKSIGRFNTSSSFVSHFCKLFRTLLFFLTTKRAVPFKSFRFNPLERMTLALKSVLTEVNLVILLSGTKGGTSPTPTCLFRIELSAFLSNEYLLSNPTNSASRRSCVWIRRFSIIPESTIITLYPASAALLQIAVKVAVFPD